MDKSFYMINTPDEGEGGAYVLLVSRGMPFGGGAGTAAFFIDSLTVASDPSGRATLFEGTKADGTVVTSFPVGTAFIVAPRTQVKGMTALEYHQSEKAEQEEIEAAMNPKTEAVVAKPAGGMYL